MPEDAVAAMKAMNEATVPSVLGATVDKMRTIENEESQFLIPNAGGRRRPGGTESGYQEEDQCDPS